MLRRDFAALIELLVLAVPLSLSAQATPYVPNLDPAYQDLDALVADGLVKDEIHAERPYSRLTFARWIVEARAHTGTSGPLPVRFREALDRLEAEFAPEVSALCADGRTACSAVPAQAVLREARADATWSNSPPRPVPTPYPVTNRSGGRSGIDAALNPLLQDNQGRRLADGETLGIESSLDVVLGRHFAGEIYPRVWASNVAAGGNTGGTAGATLEDGYVRALFGNLAVDLGRNQVEMGQSREGGPVLSYNPRGLDLVRLSLDRPARLPWILRWLGPMEVSGLVADLGRGSDTPHSKLIVFNGTIHPHPNFEIGATLENHQGGQNAPTATLKQRLEDIFFFHSPQGTAISDRAFGANMRLTLPRLKTELYVEGMSTDDHSFFRIEEWSQSLGTEAVWVAGVKRVGLGSQGRFDVWAEGRKSGVRPYTHHQFTSGMTLDGRILGDPIGVLAKGATLGVDWTGAASRLTVAGTWERYYGDSYANTPGGFLTWVKVADGPDETRERLTADWTDDMGTRRLFTRVRLGLEHVHQFEFVRGDNRVNGMVQVQAGWRW